MVTTGGMMGTRGEPPSGQDNLVSVPHVVPSVAETSRVFFWFRTGRFPAVNTPGFSGTPLKTPKVLFQMLTPIGYSPGNLTYPQGNERRHNSFQN